MIEYANDYRRIYQQRGWSFVDYWTSYAGINQADFAALDRELPNLLAVRTWLANQLDDYAAQSLLKLIEVLTAYLRQREQAQTLIEFCQSGLIACQWLTVNAGWLHLLRHEAYVTLGAWEAALSDVELAVQISRDIMPDVYARAMLMRGRLRINRGDYQAALEDLMRAERLLAEVHDLAGIALAKSEGAAYFLNRGQWDRALTLYLEADQIWKGLDPSGPARQTLFMLGVLYRKKRDFSTASAYLSQMLKRAEAQGDPAEMATALHHLAWVQLNQKDQKAAQRLARQARSLFVKLGDLRGSSDVDEQLGVIALAGRDLEAAKTNLTRALEVRRQLHNQQGTASTLRYLSFVYLWRLELWPGLLALGESFLIYWRLGVVNPHRLLAFARQVWRQILEEKVV